MSEKIWNNFVKDMKLIVPNIDINVLNKLKSTFVEMPEEFFISDKCTELLSYTIKNISDNKLKVYISLLDFKKALKSTQKLKRKQLKLNNEVVDKKLKLSSDIYDESNISKDTTNEIIHENESNILTEENNNITNHETSQESISNHGENLIIEKYIQKLEAILQATKDRIEDLEEQELTLDDLDSEMSSFVLLDKLKSHYVKVWRKVSKLRKTKCNLRKRYLKLFKFSGSIYNELNTDVENFVKIKKFPDYNDIRNLVTNFSNKNSMNFNGQKISELTLDIFTHIGNKLKKLRISDFIQYFGNHLTDQVKYEDDPMIVDASLRKVLHKNYVEGEAKMDLVIETFVKIQQSKGLSPEDNGSDISTENTISTDDELDDLDVNENQVNSPHNNEDTLVDAHVALQEYDRKENSIDNEIQQCKLIDNFSIENKLNGNSCLPANFPSNQKLIRVACDSTNYIISDDDEKPTEDYINQISSTTFQFNVDQLKNGDNSKYYSDIIVLDSDDDECNSSDEISSSNDEVINVDNSHFAYSSKLDAVFISKSQNKKPEPKTIFIELDDDDEVQEIIPKTTNGTNE